VIGEVFPRVLADARAGDPVAIELIYRDVAPLVIGYLRSNGAFDPEDVASDVFVSMIRGLAGFDGDEGQFRSWLLTITHRRLVDRIRRDGRRAEDPAPIEVLETARSTQGDVEREAIERLRARGVLEAIDELTDEQRQVLLLRILADLTTREIAEVIGKPETAVKGLLRRGLAAMGRVLVARGELVADHDGDAGSAG
jgi:RNA polymerase sigma factor (sigma-70 family)